MKMSNLEIVIPKFQPVKIMTCSSFCLCIFYCLYNIYILYIRVFLCIRGRVYVILIYLSVYLCIFMHYLSIRGRICHFFNPEPLTFFYYVICFILYCQRCKLFIFYLSTFLYVYESIFLSIYIFYLYSIYLSIYLLSISLFIFYLFIYLCKYISIRFGTAKTTRIYMNWYYKI